MSGKGGKVVDDDGNKLKMKRVKESVEKHLHDVQVCQLDKSPSCSPSELS